MPQNKLGTSQRRKETNAENGNKQLIATVKNSTTLKRNNKTVINRKENNCEKMIEKISFKVGSKAAQNVISKGLLSPPLSEKKRKAGKVNTKIVSLVLYGKYNKRK